MSTTFFLRIVTVLFLLVLPFATFAQNGIVRGRILDALSNEPVAFAIVGLQGTSLGATANENGFYEITKIQPGIYNIEVSFVGFRKKVVPEVAVQNSRLTQLDITLEEEAQNLEAVEVVASPFVKTPESPVSLRSLGIAEIQRNPGGNRDVSKVLQSLPGVATSTSFRNDLIIRGGSPNENRFYLDGIEVPNINHFATQGASGGPVGLINPNFVRNVDLYSGAFPASRGNALSSVLEFKLKEGREDKLGYTILAGSTDVGLTVDGPLSEKSSFIFSVRRSYLQFLFKALDLSFLPTYNDFQFKNTIRLNNKNRITIIGLGALDDFKLNMQANETEYQKYLLGSLPINTQWNYTAGAKYEHFSNRSNQTFVISRNHLNNEAIKYQDNDESLAENLILDYQSEEIENKFRFENFTTQKGWSTTAGLNYEFATYRNRTFNKLSTPAGLQTVNYKTDLNLHKFGAFAQLSKLFFNDKLSLSGGLRTDFNSYSAAMQNPLEQLSPRFSVAYQFLPRWSLNFNTGRYYQLPPYTVLGFRNAEGDLENKQNGVKYIAVEHLVAGLEYNTLQNGKITVEGFYKNYSRYPFLLRDSVSLANLGGDFGVVGNAPVKSISEGRAYGVETLVQQKLLKGYYGILAYTFVRSEFKDRKGDYLPSSWDSRHIVSLTGGKQLPRNWETGFKFRFTTGSPYTPFDLERSAQRAVFDVTGRGLPDYRLLNSQRKGTFYQLDFRIDKKYFFEKWSLNFYLDVENILNTQTEDQPVFVVLRDDAGRPIPADAASYQYKLLENTSGTRLPSIGVQIDF